MPITKDSLKDYLAHPEVLANPQITLGKANTEQSAIRLALPDGNEGLVIKDFGGFLGDFLEVSWLGELLNEALDNPVGLLAEV